MTELPFEKIKRIILTKKKSLTSPKYGQYPEKRSVEELLDYGIINIDKPSGPTSHQVSAYVQQILEIKKSGHSGTLDPKVTGVLPIAIGRATRIVQTLLTAGKEYVCLMHLHKEVDEKRLKQTLKHFTGKIKQLPPIKSAVKRQWRYRKIYYLDTIEIQPNDILFKVGCQAGTYIRKLAHDIGQKLGCGGHMAELRRTKAGCFKEENLYTLQELEDAYHYYRKENNDKFIRKVIQPVENAVNHLAKVFVLDSAVNSMCHGADIKVPGVSKIESEIQVDDPVAVMTLKGELIGYGQAKMISKDVIEKDKGIVVRIDKVFMLPDVYPRIEND